MGDCLTSQKSAKTLVFIVASCFLTLFATHTQARLYKWVDENGETRYSDQLPKNYMNKKHFQLDAEGRVILTKEAGKSPQQIKKERALAQKEAELKAKAAKEAERKRKQQRRQDRILLLTFNSEDDIFYARDQRLQVLDSKISLLRSIKQSSLKKLNTLNNQIDTQYRSKNLQIPGGLQQKVEQMNKKITTTNARIQQINIKRQEVIDNSAKDLARFRNLKARQRKNQP